MVPAQSRISSFWFCLLIGCSFKGLTFQRGYESYKQVLSSVSECGSCVASDWWYGLGPQALAHALETAQVENRRAQARKVMIEKRKEDAERQAAALEQQEEQDRIMQERISAAAEEERRKQERWARLMPPELCVTCPRVAPDILPMLGACFY